MVFSMKNMLTKIIDKVKKRQMDIFLIFCIILISIISYNLGQINSLKKTPITVGESSNLKADIYQATGTKTSNQNIQNTKYSPTERAGNIPDTKLDTRVVVSKNSDKYHYSWCSGAKRIKPENQIWFDNESLAQKAGYTLAGNCN